MPIKVLGNSSSSCENSKKNDTSLFVQKRYSRTNYIECKIEEDNDLKINLKLKIYLILYPYENQF